MQPALIGRGRERRLLQAVQHQAGGEEGPQQRVQRPVEVQLLDRLADDGDPLAGARRGVAADQHAAPLLGIAVAVLVLVDEADAERVETGVGDREHETAVGREQRR